MRYLNRLKKNTIAVSFGSIALLLATLNSMARGIETPVFNYESGKYAAPISVTISCAAPGAKIYYTLDGTSPNQNSVAYTGTPIVVWQHVAGDSVTLTGDNDPEPTDENEPLRYRSAVVKAVAIDETGQESAVSTAEYVIDRVDATLNLPYDDPPSAGGDKHKLDIYHPTGKRNNPVLVFVHGGAWKQGDKNIYPELGNTLAGYFHITTVIINYELSADPWHVVHPDHIEDVARAFKWVYDHIEVYGGDRDNIYLFGQSAGAHLASLLATDSNYLHARGLASVVIKGVIAMSGAYQLYDLVKWPDNPLGLDAVETLQYKTLCLNAFGGWDQGLLDSASPANFIKIHQPPFLILGLNVTGSFKDMPGFAQQAQNFYSQILALNGPAVELKLLNESDIPRQVLEMDFPADYDGHYEEIYAINTVNWNSVPAQMAADYIQDPPSPPVLQLPPDEAENMDLITELKWLRCQNAHYYQLRAATDSGFGAEALVFESQIADTSWILTELEPTKKYYWQVKSVNALGASEWSQSRAFQTTGSTRIAPQSALVPQKLALDLYPNPCNGGVNIRLDNVPASGNCRIQIYNILGAKVYSKTVELTSGPNVFRWQPMSHPSGFYFVQVIYQTIRLTNKLLFLK